MKIFILVLITLVFINDNLFPQYIQAGIDTVFYFKPGTGQNNGQSAEYFPKNIFGLPSKNASYYVPETSPDEICSIGLGGEIIVGFKNMKIVDGPGPDFTIFENAFLNPVTNRIFSEPAKIAVSNDGINYVEFPFDSLTLKGCAGTNPTNGASDPFNPDSSGGNSFDIADLNIHEIRFIKITDISQMVLDNPNHPFYDPTISGFDLDAVIGLHLQKTESSVESDKGKITDSFNIQYTMGNIFIQQQEHVDITSTVALYNYLGSEIYSSNFNNEISISTDVFTPGIYFLSISNSIVKFSKILYLNK